MTFFSFLFNEKYSTTAVLYMTIYFFTCMFAFASEKVKYKRGKYVSKFFWQMSFLIAAFFLVVGNVGTDTAAYIEIFDEASLSVKYILGSGLEPGFRFLNSLLHLMTSNGAVAIGIIRLIQISGIFRLIYKKRDELHLGFSIMAYMSLFYFCSFNILRISLAGTICLWSFYFVRHSKYKKGLLLAIIALTIHTFAIAYILVILIFLVSKDCKKGQRIIRLITIVGIPIALFFTRTIILMLLNSGLFYQRYYSYLDTDAEFGFMQLIYYVPVFIILYNWSKISGHNLKRWYYLYWIISMFGFMFALMGYSVGIFARTAIFFSVSYVFMIPTYINDIYYGKVTFQRIKIPYQLLQFFIICFWIMRFVIDTGSYMVTSGIEKYEMFLY